MEMENINLETKWKEVSNAKKQILSNLIRDLIEFKVIPLPNQSDKIESCSISLVSFKDDYPFSKTTVDLNLT